MYQITDWQRYEVNSKGQQAAAGQQLRAGPLKFVRLKVHGHSQGNGYRKLLQIAKGKTMEVFGIFCKFLEIAGDSAEFRRGVLRRERDGEPATIEDLAFLLSVPGTQIENAIKVLSNKQLEWIEEIDEDSVPGDSAELREIPDQYNTIQTNSIESNITKDNTNQGLSVATDFSFIKRWLFSELMIIDPRERSTFAGYSKKLYAHPDREQLLAGITDLIEDCKQQMKRGEIKRLNMIKIVSSHISNKLKEVIKKGK